MYGGGYHNAGLLRLNKIQFTTITCVVCRWAEHVGQVCAERSNTKLILVRAGGFPSTPTYAQGIGP